MAGRQQELAKLESYLDLACKGKGSTVLISGEAGSGKTRLSQEFLKKAKNKATILSGWCLSNAAIPYFPFVEAFDSFVSNTEAQILGKANQSVKLKRWLTEQAGSKENQYFNPEAWKDQIFASVTKELLLLAAQRPIVVFIDDIHWADSASLSLLQYLSRAIGYERVLLLATFRNEEIGAHFNAESQPLEEILRIMRRDDLYSEIRLAGLGQTEVGDIATSMLSGNVSSKLVERLTLETSGNPLFVIESLKLLAEQNGLIQENDCWAALDERVGVPDKVRDVILRRLNTLTYEAREVLDAGSVIGDKFDAQLIGAVLGLSTVKVLSILNSISKSKSLVTCEYDWYRFDHPKTREVLYEEISLPLRKEYHLRVAETLENIRLGNGTTSLGDLAYHYVNSGDKQKAIKYSLEAGKNALAGFSYAEAIKHFTFILKSLGDSRDSMEKEKALEGLGDAYHASMMFQEAIKTYKTLAAMGSPSKIRALRKAMECAFFQDSFDELRALLEEVETCDVSDRLEKARILMNKARVTKGNLPLSIKYFEEGLKLAEEEYSQWDVAWILIGLGSTLLWTDKKKRALAALLRAIEIFRELGDSRWLIEAYNAMGNALVTHFGLRKEGIDFLKKAKEVDFKEKVGDYLRLAQINASWGQALALDGDIEGALSKSLEALGYAEKTDSGRAKGVVYANLTRFYSVLGNKKKAEEYFTKLARQPPDVQRDVYVGAPAAKISILVSRKQWDDANLAFNNVFSGLRSVSAPGVEANARTAYARFLEKQGQVEQASQQKQIAQSIYDSISKQLEKTDVYMSLMVPVNLSTDQTFEMRIDLANVSKRPVSLVNMRNMLLPEMQIKQVPPSLNVEDDFIEFKDQMLKPFSVKSIKFSEQIPKLGVFNLNPCVNYTDDSQQTRITSAKAVQIHVGSAPLQTRIEDKISAREIPFKSESAEAIFDFLLKAFQQDYRQRKLPQDRSGWRTLMDLVRGAKVSRYSVYGFPSAKGQAITELLHLGLIELRVFEGERGRGGRIVKARVSCSDQNTRFL